MYSHDYFIEKLPKDFTRKDLLKLVVNEGYSISAGSNILEYGLLIGSIKRIKTGHYQKIISDKPTVKNEANKKKEGF